MNLLIFYLWFLSPGLLCRVSYATVPGRLTTSEAASSQVFQLTISVSPRSHAVGGRAISHILIPGEWGCLGWSQRGQATTTQDHTWNKQAKNRWTKGRESRVKMVWNPFSQNTSPFTSFTILAFWYFHLLQHSFSKQPVKADEFQNSLTHWEEPLRSEAIAFQLPGKAGPRRGSWCLCGPQYMLDNPKLSLWRCQKIFGFVAQGSKRVKTHGLCLWGCVVKYSESRMTQLHLFYFLVTRETRRKNLQ